MFNKGLLLVISYMNCLKFVLVIKTQISFWLSFIINKYQSYWKTSGHSLTFEHTCLIIFCIRLNACCFTQQVAYFFTCLFSYIFPLYFACFLFHFLSHGIFSSFLFSFTTLNFRLKCSAFIATELKKSYISIYPGFEAFFGILKLSIYESLLHQIHSYVAYSNAQQ